MNQPVDDNPYRGPTSVQGPGEVSRRKYSRLGIFSFLTALLGVAVAAVMFVFGSVTMTIVPGQQNGKDGLLFVLGLCVLAIAASAMTSIGLGVACVCQAGRKKLFGYVGLILGSLLTVGLSGLMLLRFVA